MNDIIVNRFEIGDIVRFYRWNKFRTSVVLAVGKKRCKVQYNTDAERAGAKRYGYKLAPHILSLPFAEITLLRTRDERIAASMDQLARALETK